jgi:hypothetical protein
MPEREQDAVLDGPGPAERGVMRLGVRSLGGAIGQRSYELAAPRAVSEWP